MEHKLDIVTIAVAISVAAYVAIAMDYVALYDLGWSIQQIRSLALSMAIPTAALIAVEFFGEKLRKSK
jgi:hypothetical protein